MQAYQGKRLPRASTIHGLAGMAAIMASTYKAYLGEGLGPLSFIKQLRIPHPGRVSLPPAAFLSWMACKCAGIREALTSQRMWQVGGYFAMNLMMPSMLGWVLGGNTGALRTADRVPSCRLGDAPKAFHERDFWRFLRDDSALLAAAHAHWTLVPADAAEQSAHVNSQAIDAAQNGSRHKFGLRIAYPETAQEILEAGLIVGRGSQADVALDCPLV